MSDTEIMVSELQHSGGCGCSACTGGGAGGGAGEEASLDTMAGGTFRDKSIWTCRRACASACVSCSRKGLRRPSQ